MEESIRIYNNKIVLYKNNVKSRKYKNVYHVNTFFPEMIIGDRFIYTQYRGNKVNIMSELVFNLVLFLKAENKVPSSKLSISPPTGNPCASFVTLAVVFFKLSLI